MFCVSFLESSASHSNIMHCAVLFNNICLINQRADTTVPIQGAQVFIPAVAFLLLLFFSLFQYFVVVFYYVSSDVVCSGVTEFNRVYVENFAKV